MLENYDQFLQAIKNGDALAIAYAVVVGLILILGIVALVIKGILAIRYWKANRTPISTNMSGADAARYVLDKNGLSHVNVRSAGFIREFFFGNYYNILTKTIYLRSFLFKIDTKKSVTSTAIAVQKAGLAKLCEDGDKQARVRNSLSLIGVFGPILFIPVLLIGVVLDFIVLKSPKPYISAICLAVSGFFAVAGFIVTMLNIPVEKKANELALEMIRNSGLATEEEMVVMKKIFDTFIVSYICDFILELLRVVEWILEILIKARDSKN